MHTLLVMVKGVTDGRDTSCIHIWDLYPGSRLDSACSFRDSGIRWKILVIFLHSGFLISMPLAIPNAGRQALHFGGLPIADFF